MFFPATVSDQSRQRLLVWKVENILIVVNGVFHDVLQLTEEILNLVDQLKVCNHAAMSSGKSLNDTVHFYAASVDDANRWCTQSKQSAFNEGVKHSYRD